MKRLKLAVAGALVLLLIVLVAVLVLVWTLDDIQLYDPKKEICLSKEEGRCGRTKNVLSSFLTEVI